MYMIGMFVNMQKHSNRLPEANWRLQISIGNIWKRGN